MGKAEGSEALKFLKVLKLAEETARGDLLASGALLVTLLSCILKRQQLKVKAKENFQENCRKTFTMRMIKFWNSSSGEVIS